MSTIQTFVSATHQDSGISVSSGSLRTSHETSFSGQSISVSTTDETVSLGDVITPQQVLIKLLSGDDLKVGFDGSDYPMRLSGVGDSLLLRLDVEGLREQTTIVCEADTGGSLSGTYFFLYDRNDDQVKVWFNTSGIGEISTVQIKDLPNLHGETFTLYASADAPVVFGLSNGGTPPTADVVITYDAGIAAVAEVSTLVLNEDPFVLANLQSESFDLADPTGAVTVWFNVNAGGSAPSTSGRLVEVALITGDDKDDVYDKLCLALNNDPSFSCVVTAASPPDPKMLTITHEDLASFDDITTLSSYIDVAVTTQGVTYEAADSVATVCTNIATAVSAYDTASEFSAVSDGVDTVTITALTVGIRTTVGTSDALIIGVASTRAGVDPSSVPADGTGIRLIPVSFTVGDTAATMATSLATALIADAEFGASVSTNTVTAIDQHTGIRTPAADFDTGWTITPLGTGAASPVVHIASVGTSEVAIAVVPV